MRYKRRKRYQGGGTYRVPAPVPVPRVTEQYQIAPVNVFTPSMPNPDRSAFAIPEEAYDAKGLTSDVNAYAQKLRKYESALNSLSDYDIITQSDKFKSIIAMGNEINSFEELNRLRRNEELFGEAKAKLKAHNGEAAVTTMGGKLYVLDKETNEYRFVDPYTYAQNQDRLEPVSGTQALYLREQAKAFDNAPMAAAESTYGLQHISKRLKDEFQSNLGEQGSKSLTDSLQAISGLNTVGLVTKGSDYSSNAEQIEKAKEAAFQFLNDDELAQLRAQAISRFGVKDPQQIELGAFKILADHFNRLKSTEQGSKFQIKDLDVMSSGSGGGGTEPVGKYESSLRGVLGKPTKNYTLAGNTQFIASGNTLFEPFADKKLKISDDVTLENVGTLINSEWKNVIDFDGIRTMSGEVDPSIIKSGVVSNKDTKGVVSYGYLKDGKVETDPSKFEPEKKALKSRYPNASAEELENLLERSLAGKGYQRVVVGEVIIPKYADGVSELVDQGKAQEISEKDAENYYQVFKQSGGKEGGFFIGEDMVKTTFIAPTKDLYSARLADGEDININKQEATIGNVYGSSLDLLKTMYPNDDYGNWDLNDF